MKKGNDILQDFEILNSIANKIYTERLQTCIKQVVKKKVSIGATHFYYGNKDLIGSGKIGERLIKLTGAYLKKYNCTPDIMGNITVHCGCCEKDFIVGVFGTFFCKEGKNYILVFNSELRELRTTVRFYQLEKNIDLPLYQGRIGGNQMKNNITKIQ
jgi:hypothetical protein